MTFKDFEDSLKEGGENCWSRSKGADIKEFLASFAWFLLGGFVSVVGFLLTVVVVIGVIAVMPVVGAVGLGLVVVVIAGALVRRLMQIVCENWGFK